MDWKYMLLLGALFILCLSNEAAAKRKHKKVFGKYLHSKQLEEDDDDVVMEANHIRHEAGRYEMDEADLPEDPCYNKHCKPGRVCTQAEDGKARCSCISECSDEQDPRRKVCSSHNETWASDCKVYQMRCWCREEDPRCTDPKLRHLHFNYYGECREIQECTPDEKADFPRRMRDWMFNVMQDLADREELSPYYLRMEKEAERNLTKKWSNAAIWQWCQLDEGHDGSVSRHEFFPIKASLVALEHCIAPFLDSCDADGNHSITLTEWARCLEIDESEITAKCEDLGDEDD